MSRVGNKWEIHITYKGSKKRLNVSEATLKPQQKPKLKYKIGEVATFTNRGKEYDAEIMSRVGNKWEIRITYKGTKKRLPVLEATLKPRPQ